MDNTYTADEIKTRVSMPELLSHYGFSVNGKNRMPCHIHGGKNDNLGIKEKYCHCFKCGYNADVIKFVQDYFSLNFAEAVSKINNDFSLGLPIGEKMDRRTKTDIARQSFLKKRAEKEKEKEKQKLELEWEDSHGDFIRIDRQKRQHKPRSICEQLPAEFIEALKETQYAKYRLECALEDLREYEKRNG